jgi:hypothetical protein
METFEFAALVVSIDLIIFGLLAARASRWLDSWVRQKEEAYWYGHKGKES